MRILLTGASGFIGQHLLHALLAEGHDVVCAVRHPARQGALPDHPRLTTIHQPVRDMAYGAADMLVAMVEDEPYQKLVDHPFALVVRESAGPAPGTISEP